MTRVPPFFCNVINKTSIDAWNHRSLYHRISASCGIASNVFHLLLRADHPLWNVLYRFVSVLYEVIRKGATAEFVRKVRMTVSLFAQDCGRETQNIEKGVVQVISIDGEPFPIISSRRESSVSLSGVYHKLRIVYEFQLRPGQLRKEGDDRVDLRWR